MQIVYTEKEELNFTFEIDFVCEELNKCFVSLSTKEFARFVKAIFLILFLKENAIFYYSYQN